MMVYMLKFLNSDVVYYIMEHRGIGRSGRLGCDGPQAEAAGSDGGMCITLNEYPACASYMNTRNKGDARGNRVFSITQAAYDVHDIVQYIYDTHAGAIHTVRGDISHGHCRHTEYLMERIWLTAICSCSLSTASLSSWMVCDVMKKIIPAVATTEGTPDIRLNLLYWDRNIDSVVQHLFEYCRNDSGCNGKLKLETYPTAMWLLSDTMKSLRNGTHKCSATVPDVDALKLALYIMILNTEKRRMMPPLLYRINRCDAGDRQVIKHFLDMFAKSLENLPECGSSPYRSEMLFAIIGASEMLEYEPDHVENLSDLVKAAADAVVGISFAPKYYKQLATFPRYDRDEYFNHTANAGSTKVLMLNGDLDSATPIASARAQYLNMKALSNNVQLLTIRGSQHGTLPQSPAPPGGFLPCAAMTIMSFVANGDGTFVNSCDLVTDPVAFSVVSPATLHALFGSDDLYEGGLIGMCMLRYFTFRKSCVSHKAGTDRVHIQ